VHQIRESLGPGSTPAKKGQAKEELQQDLPLKIEERTRSRDTNARKKDRKDIWRDTSFINGKAPASSDFQKSQEAEKGNREASKIEKCAGGAKPDAVLNALLHGPRGEKGRALRD